MSRVEILGVAVDRVSLDEAAARVEALVAGPAAAGREGRQGPARLVVTANPEILFAARTDPELAAVLEGADLVTADGVGVVWAARRLGRPVPERVPGIDLMHRLLARSADRGYRVFFLGARPEVAARAAAAARERHPGLFVAGVHHGYFGPEAEEAVAAAVRAARPDLLFTGMGAPRDQKWVWRHREALGPVVAVGVGGSFDVLAGAARRAPRWMQRLGLEWFYRLVRQPSRWRRMLALPRFAWAVLRSSPEISARSSKTGGKI